METVVTPEESDLLLDFVAELASATSSDEKSEILDCFSFKAADLYYRWAQRDVAFRLEAGFLSLVHIIYCGQDFADRVSHVQETLCRDLTAGLFRAAKALVLRHPVLSLDKETASQQQYLQAQCLTELVNVIDSRPTVTRFEQSGHYLRFDLTEPCLFLTAYQAWYHDRCLTFQGKVQDNRLALGFEFSGNIQDIANILSGDETCLKQNAEDKLAFFVARVFHTPRFVSSHLQLRLVWEDIVGRSGPQFSSWNPSLRALMMDVLSFDQKRLLAHLSNLNIPFRLFTRLMLGIALDAFFEDEETMSKEPIPSLGDGSFFDYFASKFCSEMHHIKDVLRLLMFCPGMESDKGKQILAGLDIHDDQLRKTLMEFPHTAEYENMFSDKVEAAGWSVDMEIIMGHAHQLEGNFATAAAHFRRGGVPDGQNIALKDVERALVHILSHDRDNFMRALKLEALHVEELLSSGMEREHIVDEIHILLKEMYQVLEQNINLFGKLAFFISSETEVDAESHYGLMVSLTLLLKNLPQDTNNTLSPEDCQQLQRSIEAILHHTHLSQELRILIAMRVVYIAYLFGGHVSGYLIFEADFMKSVLAILQHNSLGEIDPTNALHKRILPSMHHRFKAQV